MVKAYSAIFLTLFSLSLLVGNSNGQLQSSRILVISKLEPPFLMEEGLNTYKGFINDLAELLFRQIGKSFMFKVTNDISYEGMITELTTGKGHVILAPLTVTKQRSEIIDFSVPFMEARLAILQKKPMDKDDNEEPQEESETEDEEDDDDLASSQPWFDPFSIWLWLVFVFSSLVLLFIIFFVEKFVGGKKVQSRRTEKLFQGFSTKVFGTPRSIAARFLQIIFWVFLIVIFAVYTGNFVADRIISLINESYKTTELPINSVEQLLKQSDKIKFGFLQDSSTSAYFNESNIEAIKELNKKVAERGTVIRSYADGIDRVRRANGSFAFIMESPAAKYASTLEPCDLGVGKQLFGIKRGFSLAIRKPQQFNRPNDGMLDMQEINMKIMEMRENGVLDALETKWFKDVSECAEEDKKLIIKVDPKIYEPLCFETMGGFLILLGLSVFIVLIIAIIEVLLVSKS